LAAFVEAVSGAVEVPEAEPVTVGFRVVLRPPVPVATEVPLTPDPALAVPVAVVVGEEPVADEVAEVLPIPLPAPSDGESPPPAEARTEPVAATEAEDATLAFELATTELAVVEEGPALELLEVTAAQERSKRGVLLNGLPGTMPKLGLV
jgi:hypothetical protein